MEKNVLQYLLGVYELSYKNVAGYLGVPKEYVEGLATGTIKTDDLSIVKRLGLLFDLDPDDFDALSSSIYSKYDAFGDGAPIRFI